MNTHADKTQENKSRSVEKVVPQRQGDGSYIFQLVDNRPEAIVQRKLQDIADYNRVTTQIRADHQTAPHYPLFIPATNVVQCNIDITDDPNAITYNIPLPGAAMHAAVINVVYNGQGDSVPEAQRRYRASPDDVQQVLHGLSLIGWRGNGEALRQRVRQDVAGMRFFRSGNQPLPHIPGGVTTVPRVTRLYRSMTEPEFVQLRRAVEAAEAVPAPPGQATVHCGNKLVLSDATEEGRVSALVAAGLGHPTAPTGHMAGIGQANHHFGIGAGHKYLVEFKFSWPTGGGAPVPLLLAGALNADRVFPQPAGAGGGALANVSATRAGRAGVGNGGEGYPNLPPLTHNAVGLKAENTAGERLSVATAPFPSTHGLERLRHLAPRLDVQLITSS